MSKIITGIKENNGGAELTSYELFQNYPNPWNPNTTISYTLKENIQAKLTLLNVLGEEVAVLVNEEQDKGFHKVEFNGSKIIQRSLFLQTCCKRFCQCQKNDSDQIT